MLKLSDTWKDHDVSRVIQVVPRRAPNLQDLLFKRKSTALFYSSDLGTHSCGSEHGCQTCLLVSNTTHLHYKGKTFRTAGGDCKSWNLIYCFQCKICDVLYVGKTIDSLNERVNGHRSKFYNVLTHGARAEDFTDDEQILGVHLVHGHGMTKREDFNASYKLFILSYYNPVSIRRSEQFWIDKLKTLTPFGLNQNCSIKNS